MRGPSVAVGKARLSVGPIIDFVEFTAQLKQAADKRSIVVLSFEGARLSAAPIIEFKGFTARLKGVPLQSRELGRIFPQPESRALRADDCFSEPWEKDNSYCWVLVSDFTAALSAGSIGFARKNS
jgi:hypothetical protein